jgi:hypothetical protein
LIFLFPDGQSMGKTTSTTDNTTQQSIELSQNGSRCRYLRL